MIDLNSTAEDRTIRVFVSSTFIDFQSERELLVKHVFPLIRKLCADRNIDFLEIDLRWGITEQQAQQGSVIDVCLQAIERCHPFFIGLIGSRYGWIPTVADISSYSWLIEKYPHLQESFDQQLSITEIEIKHGVLRKGKDQPIAFFYFRDEQSTSKDYREDEASEEHLKLLKLKADVKSNVVATIRDYFSLQQLEEQVKTDLIAYINAVFPLGPQLSNLEKQRIEHAAFARSRMKVYVGDHELLDQLSRLVDYPAPPILISGQSGSGKSALLANWIATRQKIKPQDYILYHFVGGATDSTNIYSIMRRICEELKSRFHLLEEIPNENDQLLAQFSGWLRKPPSDSRWVLVLDALNQLDPYGQAHEMTWFPSLLPDNLSVIMSTVSGPIENDCRRRGFTLILVGKLKMQHKMSIIGNYLKLYEKTLDEIPTRLIADSQTTDNVLVLRTLLDELRVFGNFKLLQHHIEDYISASSPMDFFQKVLNRFESDYEGDIPGLVKNTLTLLWASHMGISEPEFLDLTGAAPLYWAPFFEALRSHLINRNGLFNFTHDYLRLAVEQRYLVTEAAKIFAHNKLSDYFKTQKHSKRSFQETPYHLKSTNQWASLKDYLVDPFLYQVVNVEENRLDLLDFWRCCDNRWDMEHEYEKKLQQYKSSLISQEPNDIFNPEIYTEIKKQQVLYGIISAQIARVLIYSSKYKLAIPLLEDSLHIYHDSGDTSTEFQKIIFAAQNLLIVIYMKQGLLYRAEPLLKKAIYHAEKDIGKETSQVGVLKCTLGALYCSIKLYDKSEQFLDDAVSIILKTKGDISPEAAVCYNNLSILYKVTDRLQMAIEYLERAIELRTLFYGRQHPETVICLTSMAIDLLDEGQGNKAVEMAREAIESSTKVMGREAPETARAYKVLGMCYLRGQLFIKAEANFSIALEINEIALGKSNINSAECRSWLGFCQFRQNRLHDAYDNCCQALAIFKDILGPDHPSTCDLAKKVEKIRSYL